MSGLNWFWINVHGCILSMVVYCPGQRHIVLHLGGQNLDHCQIFCLSGWNRYMFWDYMRIIFHDVLLPLRGIYEGVFTPKSAILTYFSGKSFLLLIFEPWPPFFFLNFQSVEGNDQNDAKNSGLSWFFLA